jgi:hypothetical protein
MAGAPAAATRGRRRRLGAFGQGGEGTALGQPDRAPYIASRYPAGLSGQSDPDNPAPPDIPPWGADIPAWSARTEKLGKFSKTDVVLKKNFELVCKD